MESGHKVPSVVIVLLNWNSRADTLECLESVFRLDYPDFRVVVCDNGSSDDSVASIHQWAEGRVSVAPASPAYAEAFAQPRRKKTLGWRCLSRAEAVAASDGGAVPELVLIETGANLGFAGGNNIGIAYALNHLRPDYFWLLNTDTIVAPDALTALVERATRDKAVGMVGSSIIYYWQPDKVQALGGASVDPRTIRMCHIGEGSAVDSIPADGTDVEARMAYVVGASMLVSREFVQQVGLMCDDYFLYYEEIDWAMRGKGRFTVAYAPGSRVFHKVGGASRRVASVASMRYMWRNRIRFVARFMPDRLAWTMASMALDMVRAGLKGRFGMFRAIAGALVDFRRLADEGRGRNMGVRP